MQRVPNTVKPLVVRPKRAREMLGNCATRTLWSLINDGKLRSYKQGTARLIEVASIEQYVAEMLQGANTK